MASIDQLQIEIQASSQDAKNAIDDLVKSLKDLNKQLGLKDGTSFARTLGSMARAMDSFTGKIKSVNSATLDNTAKSMESIARASENAAAKAEIAHKALDGLANSKKRILGEDANKGNYKVTEFGFASDIKGLESVDYAFREVKSSVEETKTSVEKLLPAVINVKDNIRQLFEADLGVNRASQQLDAVTNSFTEWKKQTLEPLLGLPMFEKQLPAVGDFDKMLPAVVETRAATDQLYSSIEDVINEGPKLDAVSKAFYDWKASLLDTARAMEQTGASFEKWRIPEAGVNPSFNREALGWVSDIKPEVVEGYFYEIEDAANKCLPAIRNVGTTALATADSFKQMEAYAKEAYEKTPESFTKAFKSWDLGTGLEEPLERLSQNARYVKSEIERATEAARIFKETISGMESGKTLFDKEKYDEAIKNYEIATDTIKNYKKELLGKDEEKGKELGGADRDVLTNIVELGEALEKVSERFNMVAEKGISIFKFLTTPLRKVTDEYKEKFSNMIGHVVNFRKNFQAHMKKVSDFWKRTMRTFTFMLVRKAITAIIKEVNNAIQSLAMFSDAMGTQFNKSISLLVADFQYLGRSIVSVFAPLIDYIAPIIDAIIDKIALLLSWIGMLMAALTGASSFTKAKKNVGNYAKSLDSASKSAKNLTMGIDELNILAENSGGGSAKPYDGWEDAWEEVDIPSWIKDIADWLKNFWDRFFAPLLEAWNRAKQYLIDGFNTMLLALGRMFGHIVDDFLTMWNQEKTIRMFEQMLRIVGDLFRVIRNLADQFDKAWQKGKVGLKIFENLRDILKIIVDHVRNVSYYMIEWAAEIDFYPMLEAFEQLTDKLKKLADFIGGVFEDIMKNVVLRYIKYMIKDAIPHLYETIARIVDAFNFPTLREKLQPVESAFADVLENIHKGTTTAIGNIGVAFARFVNSDTFYAFLQRLVDISKEITAERVEKVLTGIGEGILAIIEAIVKFVNSDGFLKFLKALGELVDKVSTQDIANVLVGLAKAIAGFKFAAFATSKLAGFFKFFTVIVALKNLSNIAKGMAGVATETTKVASAAKLLNGPASALSTLGKGASGIITGVGGGLKGLATNFLNLHNVISPITATLGSVFTAFLEFKGVANSTKDLALAINSGDENSIGGSILGLVGKIGIASAAFTAFLGFPAGLIAGLCVGAVGALKGIQDAIDQINFDQVTDAILTKGETTVNQVRQWYSDTTSIVREHIQQWKDAERNLTEGRNDIQEYSKALEGLESAFSSSLQATAGMAGQLSGIYSSMSGAIDNYIDESTTALINNLLAQRDYLESQGYNVDDMIANLLISADNEKKVVDEATKSMEEASKAYQDAVDKYGEGSNEATTAYDTLISKIGEYNDAVDRYRQKTDEIDTSEAIQQIEALGKSLDLSQYSNWDEAATEIKTALQEIRTTYETELTGANETVESKMEEIAKQFQEGRIDESEYRIQVQAITQQWTDDTNTLIDATGQSLDLFNQSLVTGLQSVAETADQEWENTNPFKRFFTMGTDKDAYIYGQMQTYVNDMLGESGLTGEMVKTLGILPNNIQPYSIDAMTRLVNDAADAYIQGTYDNEDYTSQGASGSWQNVVNSAMNMLDLQPIKDMGKSTVDSYNSGVEENTTVSKTTVQTWMTNIKDWIHDSDMHFGSPSQTMIDYGADTVLGYNMGIDQNAPTTQASIAGWFMKVQSAVSNQVVQLKSLISKLMQDAFDLKNVDVVSPINTIFVRMQTAIQSGINQLGTNLLSSILPTFMQTYILPFFNTEMWQPMFDNLLNIVFIPAFERFKTWFDESMLVWWEEHMLTWFTAERWDKDIFTPLAENIHEHFDTFSSWWDATMLAWWENQVEPWFEQEKWRGLFNHIYDAVKEVFKKIVEEIRERIQEAVDVVVEACEIMAGSLQTVLDLIGEIMTALSSGFGDFSGTVSFDFGGAFASGGFPSYGSLFVAGEPGAGAEFVGNIHGRTGVVSNGEITGIEDAVYATGNAETELLSQLISISRAMLDKEPVVITDRDIARLNNSGQNKIGMSIIS